MEHVKLSPKWERSGSSSAGWLLLALFHPDGPLYVLCRSKLSN